jgi:hypothetical protein
LGRDYLMQRRISGILLILLERRFSQARETEDREHTGACGAIDHACVEKSTLAPMLVGWAPPTL